jgi:hypothetical protein
LAKRRKKAHQELVAKRKAEKAAKREAARNQRKAVMPVSRLTDEEFNEWKAAMQSIVDAANYRISELHSQGLTTMELERFQRGDENKLFDISDAETPNELRARMTEVRAFLNGAGESNEKALIESALISAEVYRGQFGNQFSGKRYNVDDVVDDRGNIIRYAIDEDVAKRAFAAYRRLEETYASVIGRQGGEGVFGSENLIIAIYDMEARGMDGQAYGKDLLEAWMDESLKEMEGVNLSLSDAEAIIGVWDDFINRRAF